MPTFRAARLDSRTTRTVIVRNERRVHLYCAHVGFWHVRAVPSHGDSQHALRDQAGRSTGSSGAPPQIKALVVSWCRCAIAALATTLQLPRREFLPLLRTAAMEASPNPHASPAAKQRDEGRDPVTAPVGKRQRGCTEKGQQPFKREGTPSAKAVSALFLALRRIR
jgi:hypothetical protein